MSNVKHQEIKKMNNLNYLAIIAGIVGSSPGSTSIYEISHLPQVCFVCTLIVYQQLHHCRRQTHIVCIGVI